MAEDKKPSKAEGRYGKKDEKKPEPKEPAKGPDGAGDDDLDQAESRAGDGAGTHGDLSASSR